MTISGMTEQAERRLFGWGVANHAIDAGVPYARDLSLTTTASGTRDLDLVAGIPNLEQELRTAFVTALGSDPLNVGFGFDGLRAVVEEQDFLVQRERIRVATVAVLRRDPRVITVVRVLIGNEIAAFRSDQGAGPLPVPTPRGEYGVVDVEATFRIRSGQELSVSLGSVLTGV